MPPEEVFAIFQFLLYHNKQHPLPHTPMAKKRPLVQNRTLTRVESLLGVFMALLLPALSAGAALPQLTAMAIK